MQSQAWNPDEPRVGGLQLRRSPVECRETDLQVEHTRSSDVAVGCQRCHSGGEAGLRKPDLAPSVHEGVEVRGSLVWRRRFPQGGGVRNDGPKLRHTARSREQTGRPPQASRAANECPRSAGGDRPRVKVQNVMESSDFLPSCTRRA